MKKIPVGTTIAFAYRFLVTEIGTIVGIAWLPAVLSSTVSYFARLYAVEHRALLETPAPLEQVAGQKHLINDTVERLRGNLRSLLGEIGRMAADLE